MANNTTYHAIPNNVLLCSVVFKFIAMIIGILGNVTVIIYASFSIKEKTATSYLVGNLAMADLLMCLTFYPWAFMSASTATLLAITVDRYLYIIKPLRYPQIVTHRRVFLAVSGIWITACCIFIVQYIHRRSYGIWLRSVCYLPNSIVYLIDTFTGYLPLILIFFLNFHLLCVARRQRKRIFPETTITSANNSTAK